MPRTNSPESLSAESKLSQEAWDILYGDGEIEASSKGGDENTSLDKYEPPDLSLTHTDIFGTGQNPYVDKLRKSGEKPNSSVIFLDVLGDALNGISEKVDQVDQELEHSATHIKEVSKKSMPWLVIAAGLFVLGKVARQFRNNQTDI